MTKKRLVTITIIFFLFIAIGKVIASEIYDLRDLTQESPQFVGLYPKDFVRFEYFNATHIVQIEKVLNEQEVNIIVFPYKQNGTYLTIGRQRTLKLDLNRDLNDDIEIIVFKVEDSVTVLRFDNLQNIAKEQNNSIILPEEFTDKSPTSNVVLQEQKNTSPIIGILIIVIAIILGAVIANIIKKQKK